MEDKLKMMVVIVLIVIALAIIFYRAFVSSPPATVSTTSISVSSSSTTTVLPSISNVSANIIASIGAKNNFSVEYFDYVTVPAAYGNGPSTVTNAYFIYTKYDGAMVLNVYVPGNRIAKSYSTYARSVYRNDTYTWCITYNESNYCNTVPANSLAHGGLSGTFLNYLTASLSRPYQIPGNGIGGITTRSINNLTISDTVLTNASWRMFPCALIQSRLQDPTYPGINGTLERCISKQYWIPVFINVTLNDPYYNNTYKTITERISMVNVNEYVNSTYFNFLTSASQLFPRAIGSTGKP